MIKLGFYQYYEGGVYEVIANAIDANRLTAVVVYKKTHDDSIVLVEERELFNQSVYKDGQTVQTFTYLGDKLTDWSA